MEKQMDIKALVNLGQNRCRLKLFLLYIQKCRKVTYTEIEYWTIYYLQRMAVALHDLQEEFLFHCRSLDLN